MAPRSLSRRLLVPLMLVALGAAGPLAVLASHRFTDVPTSSTFHSAIDRIADAAITTGCGPGLYCPKDYVTREQMAAFLARSGGRVGYNSGSYALNTAAVSDVEVTQVTIHVGDVPGGTGFVKLDASMYGFIQSGCTTCQVTFQIAYIETGILSPVSLIFLQNTTLGQESQTASLTWVLPVDTLSPTAESHFFGLFAQITYTDGASVIPVSGQLAVTYFPFSEDGDDTLN